MRVELGLAPLSRTTIVSNAERQPEAAAKAHEKASRGQPEMWLRRNHAKDVATVSPHLTAKQSLPRRVQAMKLAVVDEPFHCVGGIKLPPVREFSRLELGVSRRHGWGRSAGQGSPGGRSPAMFQQVACGSLRRNH